MFLYSKRLEGQEITSLYASIRNSACKTHKTKCFVMQKFDFPLFPLISIVVERFHPRSSFSSFPFCVSSRAPEGDGKSVYRKFDFSIGKHHNSEFTNIHFSKHKFFHLSFSCFSSPAFASLSAFRGSLTSMKRALQMKGNERRFDEC